MSFDGNALNKFKCSKSRIKFLSLAIAPFVTIPNFNVISLLKLAVLFPSVANSAFFSMSSFVSR